MRGSLLSSLGLKTEAIHANKGMNGADAAIITARRRRADGIIEAASRGHARTMKTAA